MRKIYYGKANYGNEEIKASIKVLKKSSLSLMDGNNVRLFEKKSLDYLQKIWRRGKFWIISESFSIIISKFKKGGEVITPLLTF